MNELRPARTGWRAYVYRGRHRSASRAGQIMGGVSLYYALYLR